MPLQQVEPTRCILWPFHERFGDELSGGLCRDLIASIRRHGQRHPVLGRKLEQQTGAAIELIYGGRRLFAAKQLGIKLLVDVRELDDRAAIIEMEIENRLRADISAYERGMSYRRWLNARVFACQSELAKQLGVSEAQVSRLLRYAELPAAVVGAFDSFRCIREDWAITLAKLCQDPERRPGLLRRARELSEGDRRYPPQMVFRRLTSEGRLKSHERHQTRDEVVKNSSGKPMYRIAVRAKAVHFIIPRDRLPQHVVHQLKQDFTHALEQVMRDASPTRKPFLERTNRSEPFETTNVQA